MMARMRARDGMVAASAGGGAALVVLTMPVALIEMLIASAGISEVLPAAAPPLGIAVRLVIAAFAGLMAIGIAWTFRGKTRVRALSDSRAKGEKKMGFALSKLTAFARGRSVPRSAAPVLRRADAHPDAPARAPIFASRDLDGVEIFHGPSILPKDETVVSGAGLDMPRAPEPLAEADLPPVPGFTSLAEESSVFDGPVFAPSFPQAPMDDRPIASLSISELTERLERGLAHRAAPAPAAAAAVRVIADMPVAAPVPVAAIVEPDVDEALRAALGTLRTLATRVG